MAVIEGVSQIIRKWLRCSAGTYMTLAAFQSTLCTHPQTNVQILFLLVEHLGRLYLRGECARQGLNDGKQICQLCTGTTGKFAPVFKALQYVVSAEKQEAQLDRRRHIPRKVAADLGRPCLGNDSRI